MQVYQIKYNIIFPQMLCISIIFFYIFLLIFQFLYIDAKISIVSIVLSIIICQIITFIFIYYGINKKNYLSYNISLCFSINYVIIASIIKIFIVIYLIRKVKNHDYKHSNKSKYISFIFLIILSILIDCLLIFILFCYKRKVKFLCSNFQNKIFTNPLVPKNLVNNYYVESNIPNVQNLNNPNLNINIQDNNQKLNVPYVAYVQPYNQNLN